MNTRVLTTADPAGWDAWAARAGGGDVYFTAGYHAACEANGDGQARLFVADDGRDALVHPILMRPIPDAGEPGWYDLESAYGYTGPLATTADPGFLARAWGLFSEWCRGHRVVAEFVRFHPLLGNSRLGADVYQASPDRQTVAVRLGPDLWAEYPSVHRNMVNKARKHGLRGAELTGPDAVDVFRALYEPTMRRLGAAESYLFSDAYYQALAAGLGDRLKVFAALDGDRPVAAGLFLLGPTTVHYHLSGSDRDALRLAPNNLLLHTVAEWGAERGFGFLHLGGGRTPRPDDELFRFKAGLSRERFPFHLGRRVHDAGRYQRLCSAWLERNGPDRPDYFLLYRRPGRAA
ncbi:MAG: hypothetical protein C0501_28120 [Isosphaera sp.]|nr:hypothetical protein [Isosphaera sp.]